MELLLTGIIFMAAAAFLLLTGAYWGQQAALEKQESQPLPDNEEAEKCIPPLTEEEQQELAEKLAEAAADIAGGIAETLGAQFVDFSQVIFCQSQSTKTPRHGDDSYTDLDEVKEKES